MLGERFDRDQRLEIAHAFPVGQQLVLVRESPFPDQAQRSRRERAREERAVDADRGEMLGVLRMEWGTG